MKKKVYDLGLKRTRVQASVVTDPVDRADREVHQQPQGGRVYFHPRIHQAGNPRKVRARYEEMKPALIFLGIEPRTI